MLEVETRLYFTQYVGLLIVPRGGRSGMGPIAFGSGGSQASPGLPERIPNTPA